MKVCRICAKERPLEAFRLNGIYPRGECNLCEQAYKRKHRKLNPGEEYRRRKRSNNEEATVDTEISPRLKTAPIREWLLRNRGDLQAQEIAWMAGLDSVGVGRIINGTYTTAHLDTVDKLLVAFGEPMQLGRLYPELYDDPSVFA